MAELQEILELDTIIKLVIFLVFLLVVIAVFVYVTKITIP